jgi:hypothetical protein
MERKTNKLGFHYYDQLPDHTRPGTMHDFVDNGIKKVGMEYLVYSEYMNQYQVYVVRPATTGKKIKQYIDDQRLYIFTNT